ncbi:hypothetical protein BD779DRAFT_1669601 [Infundibulicybe gibba]|nr:hypothetical protein BD779DRAFT_1669601 [Infundibulicybe gibba]
MAEAEKGRFPACLEIATQMKLEGVAPDLATYNALMFAAAHDACWFETWAILDDMLLLGVKPTAATFNHLIHAQRQKSSPYLWKVVEKMEELNIPPNSGTFTLIIQRFVADGNLELALQYFHAMRALKFVPELRAAQSMVSLTAQQGYPRLAIDLAVWFEQNSIRRLEHAAWMNCLISSADNLYADGVLTCWKMVVEDLNLTPDEGLCVAVLNTAARHGLPDLATDVLRVLKSMGAPWKEHHFASLIEAFCRDKQLKEAFMTLEIMRTNGVEPITGTTLPILESISKDIDAVDAAWTIIETIHKEAKRVDVSVLKTIIEASVSLGDLQRAIGTYKSYSEYGAVADVATFNLLLQGCITARHRGLGDLLLSDMKTAKIKPDKATYQHMVELCLTQDMYEDAFFYLEEMKSVGHTPARRIYENLILKCHSLGDPRYNIALDEMREYGYDLSPQLAQEIKLHRSQHQQGEEKDRVTPKVGISGAAQRFVESGGLGVQT